MGKSALQNQSFCPILCLTAKYLTGITATPIHTHVVVQGCMSACNMFLVSKIQIYSLVLRPWNEASSNPELLSQQSLYPRLWEISETKLLDLRLLAPIHKAVHVLGGDCMALFTVGCSGLWNSNHEWSMDPQLLGTQRLTVRLYVISTSGKLGEVQGFIQHFELGGRNRGVWGHAPPRKIFNLDPLRLLLTQSVTNLPNNILMTHTYVQ